MARPAIAPAPNGTVQLSGRTLGRVHSLFRAAQTLNDTRMIANAAGRVQSCEAILTPKIRALKPPEAATKNAHDKSAAAINSAARPVRDDRAHSACRASPRPGAVIAGARNAASTKHNPKSAV